MLTSLTISKILAEGTGDIFGGRITSIEFFRKERTVQVIVKGRRRYALTLSFHPQRSGFFILPAGKSVLDTTEKYRPFAKEIWEGEIIAVRQVPNDRLVEIDLQKDNRRWTLLFEVLGPNGNLWLLDEKGYPFASLRNKPFQPDKLYQAPPLPEKLDPARLNEEQLYKVINDFDPDEMARLLEKNIYGFDTHLAHCLLRRAENNAANGELLGELVHQIKSIAEMFGQKDGDTYAYRFKGKSYFYPIRLHGIEPLGKYKSVSEAQKKTLDSTRESQETEDHRERSFKFLDLRIKKAERLLERLSNDVEEAANYEIYLQYVDLLKIHLDRLKRGQDNITVSNLFSGGEPITIKLDPKLDGPENIEYYSRKYRKGREGLDILKRRRDNTRQEYNRLNRVRAEFEQDFEHALHEYPDLIPSDGVAKATKVPPARPYREYKTSTGLTVLVGKSGDNNDRTTFEYAKPYELWFHTSQCPGSHVVLKFPHKNFEPSRLEIEESAAMAAYHSKARGSGKVPVSYTQKKYVRKPRRAKAGLVTIEKETTILVEPRELEKADE